jgi:hypothetical protein
MINTKELMLGNLVEVYNTFREVKVIEEISVKLKIDNKIAFCLSSEINPIPLTEGIIKKLRIDANLKEFIAYGIDSVHKLQNHYSLNPIDITPLLSPRYTTHDGVEVWEGDEVYYYSLTEKRIDITYIHSNLNIPFFSTLQSCQSYIDSLTCKPIFTTEDGVGIFEGDTYYYCRKSGFWGKLKAFVSRNDIAKSYSEIDDGYSYFSTHELAQAYLNKVWAEKEYNDLISKK